MRRVALAVVSTVTGLIFLLSFKTHSVTTTPAAAISPATTGTDQTGSASSSTSASSSAGKTSHASTAAKTITGDAVETQYGPVQVQITVKNGTITAVNAVEYPVNDPRDQEINSYAIPELNQEALSAQSAQIDTVSGATYTSSGYLSSLQSALDQAGL
jgi:uncharacterized protein with FMN-binding domain